MIARGFRLLVSAGGALLAALAVIVVLGAWRLSMGPVSADILTPTIESALGGLFEGLRVRIGATYATWAGWSHLVRLRADDVLLVDSDGHETARAPSVFVSLDPAPLLRGVVAPVDITVDHPTLRLRRSGSGIDLALDDAADAASVTLRDIDPAALTGDSALAHLQTLEIIGANLVVEDERQGRRLDVPASRISVSRNGDDMSAELDADLVLNGEPADLVVLASWSPRADRWEAAMAFGNVRPRSLARMAPELEHLAVADAPMHGTVTATGNGAGDIVSVGFDVTAGNGAIIVADEVLTTIGGPAVSESVAVESMLIRGRYVGTERRLEVSSFEATFPRGQRIRWPGSPGLSAPLRAVSGRGRYLFGAERLEWDRMAIVVDPSGALQAADLPDLNVPLRSITFSGAWDVADRHLHITSLAARVAGAIVSVVADVTGPGEARTVVADVSLTRMTMDDVARLWPAFFKPNVRAWSMAHLDTGSMEGASANVRATMAPDGVTLDDLSGTARFRDVTIDYLPPMPPVVGADIDAVFDKSTVTFATLGGAAGAIDGVPLSSGTVRFTGLGTDSEIAHLEVSATGELQRVFRIIDHPPLRYARAVGINPDDTSGRAEVTLALRFPLLDALTVDEIQVEADASAEKLRIANAVFGRDLHDGTIALRIDKSGVDISGEAWLGGIRGDILGREDFAADAEVHRRLDIQVPAAHLSEVQKLFLAEDDELPRSILDGDVSAEIRVIQSDAASGRIEADLDFASAFADVPYFGWEKPVGSPASAEVVGEFAGGVLVGIPQFSINAQGLILHGAARFSTDGALQRVDLDSVVSGRTDAAGSFAPQADGGWSVAVRGRSIDLEPLIAELRSEESGADTPSIVAQESPVTLTAEVGDLWLAPDRRLRALSGSVERKGGLWSSVVVDAAVDDGSRFALLIKPDETGNRVLSGSAENTGSLLRTFGVFDDMTGGRLSMYGRFDDSRPSRPVSGQVSVADYHVRNAPFLAQVLGVLALTEIDNTLRGEGLSFDVLEVPFTYADPFLTVTEARANGISLGFTASGTVDMDTGAIAMRGTVVPVYALNSALGHLPLVGYLFSGGEKGGGIFAATYSLSGSLDDTNVIVNPLAVLTPGVLRQVFEAVETAPANGQPAEPEPAFSDSDR